MKLPEFILLDDPPNGVPLEVSTCGRWVREMGSHDMAAIPADPNRWVRVKMNSGRSILIRSCEICARRRGCDVYGTTTTTTTNVTPRQQRRFKWMILAVITWYILVYLACYLYTLDVNVKTEILRYVSIVKGNAMNFSWSCDL